MVGLSCCKLSVDGWEGRGGWKGGWVGGLFTCIAAAAAPPQEDEVFGEVEDGLRGLVDGGYDGTGVGVLSPTHPPSFSSFFDGVHSSSIFSSSSFSFG